MKNSETEKEITGLIKDALDHYKEDYIPGAWENFVQFRRRKKRILIFRIASGLAACLMIGWLGFGYFNSEKEIKSTATVIKESQPFLAEKAITRQDLSKKENLKGIFADLKKPAQKRSNSAFQDSSAVFKGSDEKRGSVSTHNDQRDSIFVDSDKKVGTDSKDPDSTISKRFKSAEKRIKTDNRNLVDNVPVSEKKKIRFGINFSPGVNSTQAGSAFNYSGGLSTDINLFADVYLSTGLQVEHQSVRHDNNIAAASGMNTFGTSVSRITADLVNLDLPINLTWKFFTDKSRSFYVSGGISSLAYLSEKYDKTTSFRQLTEIRSTADRVTMENGLPGLSYKVENVEISTQQKEPSFNAIDWAGRINIIFGIEQRLSPKFYLHLEPYMKIPVSGLATEKLRFSTGGVSCKISF
jgi:hypothetical protein